MFRDELKRHYTLGEFWVEVEMEDLSSFDEDLSDCLHKLPTENLPLVSRRPGPPRPCRPALTVSFSLAAGGGG